MKSLKIGLALVLALALSSPAAAWGPTGHRLVASLAEDLLTPNAKQHVQDILAADYDLGQSATWADCVRSVKRQADGTFKYIVVPMYQAPCVAFMTPQSEVARMQDYVSRNYDNCPGEKPCAADYHFSDVPVQVGHYEEGGVGTDDFDVVHALKAVIAVLQDKPAPAPFSFIDKKEALILLAHYVGDIHQPLHVGAIYLTPSGQVRNPADAADVAKWTTRGGNWIMTSKTEKLHALWDGIPAPWSKPEAHDDFIADARAVPAPAGDVSTWPEQWANDSITAADGAFDGLKYKKLPAKAGMHLWMATSPDPKAFLKYRRDTQKTQITRAAAHLAAVLNTIWP